MPPKPSTHKAMSGAGWLKTSVAHRQLAPHPAQLTATRRYHGPGYAALVMLQAQGRPLWRCCRRTYSIAAFCNTCMLGTPSPVTCAGGRGGTGGWLVGGGWMGGTAAGPRMPASAPEPAPVPPPGADGRAASILCMRAAAAPRLIVALALPYGHSRPEALSPHTACVSPTCMCGAAGGDGMGRDPCHAMPYRVGRSAQRTRHTHRVPARGGVVPQLALDGDLQIISVAAHGDVLEGGRVALGRPVEEGRLRGVSWVGRWVDK